MPSPLIKESDFRSDSGDWELFEVTEDYRRWRLPIGPEQWIVKTEYLGDEILIDWNTHKREESRGKRVGEWTHVGSVPLNMLYNPKTQIAEKLKEGDKDHLKWFLNHEDGRPYKTWWGKL